MIIYTKLNHNDHPGKSDLPKGDDQWSYNLSLNDYPIVVLLSQKYNQRKESFRYF